MERFFYPSETGLCDIAAYKWLPEGEPKAVVQIVHGMAEHALRYDDLALFLNSRGYAVFAEDHAGHGASINGKVTLPSLRSLIVGLPISSKSL